MGENPEKPAANRPSGPPPEKSLKERLKVNPKLFSVKLLVFLVYGGSGAILPYVTMHMKSLGISVAEIAVIMLLVPILSSIGPTLSGALADRLGNYKTVLISFTLVSTVIHACMWFAVPAYRITPLPVNSSSFENLTILIPCDGSAFSHISENQTISVPFEGKYSLRDCKIICSGESRASRRVCFSERRANSTVTPPKFCVDSFVELEQFDFATQNGSNGTTFVRSSKDLPKVSGPSYDKAQCFPEDCGFICGIAPHQALTSAKPAVIFETESRMTTIVLYFTFRFLSMTAFRGVNPILDAAVLEYSKQHRADFGIQRLYASVGSVVAPPLSGWLTAVASASCGCLDFGPALYLFAGMNILAAILMARMDIRVKQPQTQILKTIGVVLRNPDVVAFLIVVFFTGVGWGILLTYLFLFMEDDPDFQFTASTWMLGLLNALGYALGIPILFFSTQLIRLVGHENLLALGVLCYAGRFLGYSITYNPWLIYPTEALTAFTFLVFVLAPQFAMKTAPKYLATLNGLFGAANFGLGGGIGPLIGGLLINWLGYRNAFRILAIAFAVVGTIYLLVYHLILKRRRAKLGAAANEIKTPIQEMRPIAAIDTGILSGSSMALATGPIEQMTDQPKERPEEEPFLTIKDGNGSTVYEKR